MGREGRGKGESFEEGEDCVEVEGQQKGMVEGQGDVEGRGRLRSSSLAVTADDPRTPLLGAHVRPSTYRARPSAQARCTDLPARRPPAHTPGLDRHARRNLPPSRALPRTHSHPHTRRHQHHCIIALHVLGGRRGRTNVTMIVNRGL